MSSVERAAPPPPLQLKMPSGSSGRPPMQSSRSSRRGAGSSAPKVVLGGGAGILGSAQGSKSGRRDDGLERGSPFLASTTSPRSPHFPVQFHSPSSPSFPPAISQAPAKGSSLARPPSPKRKAAAGTSNSSLSTTASTSSRTLKTPHSKLDSHRPEVQIANSSSGSHDGHPSPSPAAGMHMFRTKEAPSSPTPAQPRKSSLGAARDNNKALPAIAQQPLPPLPPLPAAHALPQRKAPLRSVESVATSKQREVKKEQRLSQDWVQVPVPESAAEVAGPSPPRPSAARSRSAQPNSHAGKLPAAGSVPMKGGSPSPQRPTFDRANTAPISGETFPVPGRASLDQLRSTSPSPAPRSQPQPMRQRLNSMSTPPAVMLDSSKEGKGAGMGMFRNGTAKRGETPPPFRRSEDMLRSSEKADQKAQQAALGSGAPPGAAGEERKSSGLSLKKSSGALKALFNRGASSKGKEKEVTPPMPSTEERKVSMTKSAPTADTRPSFARPRTPSANSPLIDSPKEGAGRANFSTERAMYPAPPMQRAASDSAARTLSANPPSAPTSRPTPTLPRLPAPETLAPSDSDTSLAYMARNSVVIGETRPLSMYRDEQPQLSSLPSAGSLEFERKGGNSEKGEDYYPGLPTVKSLHLLALPDMDLNFDVSFDGIGSSPTTPRKARKAGPSADRSPIPSPQRSRTLRLSPQSSPTGQRHRAERRRSKSFDGVGAASIVGDMWRGRGEEGYITPNVAKLFGNPSSSSAPLLSKQLVDFSSSPDLHLDGPAAVPPAAGASSSLTSGSAESSAMSHDRTPSNASSMNESTASPSTSPPRTPPDANRQFGAKPVYPTRSASGDSQEARSSSEDGGEKWAAMGKAPSVSLPALPELGPAVPSMIVTPATLPSPTVPPVKLATIDIPATVPEQELASPANIGSNTMPGPSSKPDVLVRPTPPPARIRTLHTRSQRVVPDALTTTRQLMREMETLLQTFKYPSHTTTGAERAAMVRSELLSLVAEIDKRPVESRDESINASLRESGFQWAEALLFELRVDRAANERGACLEGLAAVLESSCLSEKALQRSKAHQERFTQTMIKAMTFVMGKLGAKGVFHNTLLFSGRFLAFAFFRIPHIAEQLVTVLPPPRGALMRFTRPVLVDTPVLPESAKPRYPTHLAPLCFDDSRSYTARLSSLTAEFATSAERAAFLFQPGNWLRRWQSDDSELFPAFYRAYHRQLANYLSPTIEHFEKLNLPLPASVLMRAPGYAHLATIFATKCHSYILGSVNAVTTSSSANNFEAQETAGFRGSQKPAVLETANRRIVETISTFANLRMIMPAPSASGHMIECEGSQLWGDMIDVWTKSIISKTSLYAPKGVFSLFDLLDGIVDPPFDTLQPLTPQNTVVPASLPTPFVAESLLDVPHLIHVIRMVLTQGEHALTLVKVIAFVFTHWEVLTARAEDRRELCLGLLLTKELFERLTLFWSQSVRSYVLRLVVFRLGHLHTKAEDGEAHRVEIESVKLLQTRLDRIKKRHDELEPKPASFELDSEADFQTPHTPLGEDSGLSHSRSTITMVQDSPLMGGTSNKAERLLGLGFGMEAKEEEGRIGKATNWFKKRVGGKKGGKGSGGGSSSRSPSPSPSMEGSPFLASTSSPKLPAGSPLLRPSTTTPKMTQKSGLGTPMIPSSSSESNESSAEASSSSLPAVPSMSTATRKAPPPTILTTHHSPEASLATRVSSPRSPSAGVAFEFELPTASPRSDAFDPPTTVASPRRQSQPPSPRGPSSPHMSRSFSKRSSLLPPPTASALDSLLGAQGSRGKGKEVKVEQGYPVKMHAYAIRMLAELEDAQKEYDEWWSENGVGRMDGAPPRLTVAWPFHEGDD